MASIRLMVDTFGPPPREICLDWIQQISAAERLGRDTATSDEPPESALAAALAEPHWTNVEVGSDGRLLLEGLSASMARRAIHELEQWLACAAPGENASSDRSAGRASRESEPSAESFGACATLDPDASNCGPFQRHATGKRSADSRERLRPNRRSRWIAAGVSAVTLCTLFIWASFVGDASAPQPQSELADSTATAHTQPQTNGAPMATNPVSAVGSYEKDLEEDFSLAQRGTASMSDWTTSAELTGDALGATATPSPAFDTPSTHAALHLLPTPSLLREPSEVTTGPAADSASTSVNARDIVTDSAGADSLPAATVSDVMSQVAAVVEKAELHQPPEATEELDSQPTDGVDKTSKSQNDDTAEWTRQPPLMLTREGGGLATPVPRNLSRRMREPHWTARIELADGYVCDPAPLQTLDPRQGAQWHIYDAKAKSPRACVIVTVVYRSRRESALEWSVRGGSEDMPELRLPLARKWLDALAVQLKVTAKSLQAIIDTPSSQVPREVRSLVQQRRQLARSQLSLAERLLELLADIDQLSGLLDDELRCHAELRDSAGGAILLAHGTCQVDSAEAASEVPPAE